MLQERLMHPPLCVTHKNDNFTILGFSNSFSLLCKVCQRILACLEICRGGHDVTDPESGHWSIQKEDALARKIISAKTVEYQGVCGTKTKSFYLKWVLGEDGDLGG